MEMTPEPSRARTIKPEPYTGPIYRIEGGFKYDYRTRCDEKESSDNCHLRWEPIEEYSNPVTAETRLKYWKHEFPFKDLFVWRVTEQCQQPKP